MYKQKKVTEKCAVFDGGYSNSEHLACAIEFHNSTEEDVRSVSESCREGISTVAVSETL